MIEKTEFGDPFGGPSMLQCNCAHMCDDHPNCGCWTNATYNNNQLNLHYTIMKQNHDSVDVA